MKKILIIDEDRWHLEPIIDAIESSVICEIHFAIDCSSSITQFLHNNYDHIILDLMLPVGEYEISKEIIADDGSLMFGIQLLKFFRSKNKTVNIVGYSVADSNEIRKVFFEANAKYICKIEEDSYDKLIKIVTTK